MISKNKIILTTVFITSFLLASYLFGNLSLNDDPSKADITIDFEAEDPLEELWMRDVCCNDSIVIVDKPVRNGEKSARMTLNPKHNFSKVGNIYKTRNEVLPNEDLQKKMNKNNISVKDKESWYGLSIRPKENLYLSQHFEVVFQLHHINDECDTSGGNPPVAIYVEGGSYVVQNVGDKDRCQKDWSEVNKNAKRWNFPLNRGEWTDWVIHTNWKHTEEGLFEVWRNGEKVIETHGPVTYNDEKVHFFQFGPYKSPWLDHPRRSNRTYYYDNFRVSGPDGSYAEVAPRK